MADFVVPTARAVFLCGHVATNRGIVHLTWVFDAIRPELYPYTHELMHVVVQLTDGLGNVPVSVRVIRLTEQMGDDPPLVVRSHPVLFRFANRFTVHRAILRMANCVFPEPGLYLVEVYCGDQCVGDATLRLHPPFEESDE